MIGIEDYKKALGDITDELSDEDIIKVRQIQDDLAEILFPLWLEKIKEEKIIISPLNNELNISYERK